MTRHLVVAQGIKAIADPTTIAKKLRIEDLGFAGSAVVRAKLPKDSRAYLSRMPERRGDPPDALVGWISDVVEKGVQVGFLKQQHGLPSLENAEGERPKLKNLFETWIRTRWAKLAGALFGGLFVIPAFVYTVLVYGLSKAIVFLVVFVVIFVVYLFIVFLMVFLLRAGLRFIGYPIIRRLSRGIVPLPSGPRKPPSEFREKITRTARSLGFLPR
jgi:hypothetical protein